MSSNTTDPGGSGDGGTSSISPTDRHPFVQFVGLVNGSWFIFFVISVASAKLGGFVRHVGMPLITGYMFVGVLTGPFILGMVRTYQIPDLAYVTQTALAFIAFSAGSELYLPELRSLFKPIAWLTLTTSTVTYLICSFIIFAMSSNHTLMGWMSDYPSECRLMISLIAGAIMVARSPASAIAVVRELNAHGRLTSCMLGVTVVGDVVVLLLFALSSSLALASCSGDGFKGAEFLLTILSLLMAVGFGYAFGYLFILLLWMPRAPWAKYTILPFGLLIFMLCDWFQLYSSSVWGIGINFDALLICITAGYVVTNQSQNRIAFMLMLGRFGPYVFIPFFTKVGIELNLTVLYQSIGFAIIIFFIRAACMFAGGWSGGKMGGLSMEHCSLVWLTMLSQAGVSLGLASEISVKFSNAFGPDFQTAVVAVVVINQLIGPITCKYAIRRAKEADRLGPDGQILEEGASHDTGAPDLQLSYEHEELDENIDLDAPPSQQLSSTDSQSPRLHRRSSMHRQSFGGMAGGYVTNIHGARYRKTTRKRALIIGLDSYTLATAQRLLDLNLEHDAKDSWSLVLMDESAEACKQAETVLLHSSTTRAAKEQVFDPLPSLLRKVSALASKTTQQIESGLDVLLPVAEETDQDSLMGNNAMNGNSTMGPNGAPGKKRTPTTSSDELSTSQGQGNGRTHIPTSHHRSAGDNSGQFTELTNEDVDVEVADQPDQSNDEQKSSPETSVASASPRHQQHPSVQIDSSSVDPAAHLTISINSPPMATGSQSQSVASRTQIHRLVTDHHQSLLEAYRAIEEEFFLSRDGIDTILINLPTDSSTYELAAYLTDRRRFSRVIARVQHPSWSRVFAGIGVIPIYHLSVEAHLLTQLLTDDSSTTRSSTTSLTIPFISASSLFGITTSPTSIAAAAGIGLSELMSSTIHSEDDLLCAMQDLAPPTRTEFLRLHPAPPAHLSAEAMQKSLTRPQFLSVVSEAHRDGYMTAIAGLHQHTTNSTKNEVADEAQRAQQDVAFGGGLSAMRHQQRLQRAASTVSQQPPNSLPSPTRPTANDDENNVRAIFQD